MKLVSISSSKKILKVTPYAKALSYASDPRKTETTHHSLHVINIFIHVRSKLCYFISSYPYSFLFVKIWILLDETTWVSNTELAWIEWNFLLSSVFFKTQNWLSFIVLDFSQSHKKLSDRIKSAPSVLFDTN